MLEKGEWGGEAPSLGNFHGYIRYSMFPTQNSSFPKGPSTVGCLVISAKNEVQIHSEHINVYQNFQN